MSRNASGSYSLPGGNPVVSGTTISSSWANTTLSDLSVEVTDSLSRSGKGGMLAALKLTDGTVAAPALSFSSEGGTGLFRAGSNDLRVAMGGVEHARLTAVAGSDPAWLLKSPQAAGGTVDDFRLDTVNARTTGSLFSVRTNAVEKFSVGWNGVVRLPGVGSVLATATDAALNLLGNRAAASGNADVVLGSSVNRTAGNLLDVQNNAVSKYTVNKDGDAFTGANKHWHAGNDGAASTLDADLLDGQEGAFYQSASNLNAGTVPSARLPIASGAALGAVMVGTGLAIDGSGVLSTSGGAGFTSVFVTADTTCSTTATDVTGASFAMVAGTYLIRIGFIHASGDAGTYTMAMRMKGTGAPTTSSVQFDSYGDGAAGSVQTAQATAVDTDVGTSSDAGQHVHLIVGVVVATGSGTFQLQGRRGGGTANPVVKAGTHIEYRKIA